VNPVCPYCGHFADLVTGKVIYPHRPDLANKRAYRCDPCDAHVGCHPGTIVPLGRLANAELRAAKMSVHEVFDKHWMPRRPRGKYRGQCYVRLAAEMGIDAKDCHIGHFTVEQCKQAVELINQWRAP
jgi:hypothetical protein